MSQVLSQPAAGSLRRNFAVVAALALVFALLPFAGAAQAAHVGYSTFESPSNDTVVNHATGESAPPEGAAEAVSEQDGQIPTQRFNGSDRHGTAQQIAQYDSANLGPNHGSDTVLLARSNLFPDALAGNYLAGQTDASLLLTATDTYVDNTQQALQKLSENQGVSNVTILGSTQAISEDVAQQIEDDGFNVDRIGGAGRYETAAEILEAGDNIGTFQGNSTAIVANGNDFPDALVSGALSYEGEFPILLTEQDNLVDTTEQALQDNGVEQVIIPGGPAAVSDQVESEIESVTGNDAIRRQGDTRVTTAISIAEFAENNFAFDRSEVNFARGGSTDDTPAFADALTIGPHAGLETSILLLTQSESNLDGSDNPVAGFLGETACDRGLVHLSGGFAAIQESVEGEIRDAATAEDSPCQITLTPQSATNQVGETHTVTTTVTDNGGTAIADQSVTVTAEGEDTAQPTPSSDQGSTNDDGEFQFSFTSQTPGDVEITATTENADGDDITATATKTFEAGPPPEQQAESITVRPETDTNVIGSDHEVTAEVTDEEGDPVSGQQVQFTTDPSEGQEANPSTGQETTDESGEATFTFSSDSEGEISVTGSTDSDGETIADTVTKTYSQVLLGTAGEGGVALTPETDTNVIGSDHQVTATVTDDDGNELGGAQVRFEVTGGGSPSPDTGQGTTDSEGETTFTFSNDTAGDNEITACTNQDGSLPSVCANAGASDFAEKSFVEAGDVETLRPQEAENTVGTSHEVTATVQESDGDEEVDGVQVRFEVTGDGNPSPSEGSATTNDDGGATFTFSNDTAGENTITACGNQDGSLPQDCGDADFATGDGGTGAANASKTFVDRPTITDAVLSNDNAPTGEAGLGDQATLTTDEQVQRDGEPIELEVEDSSGDMTTIVCNDGPTGPADGETAAQCEFVNADGTTSESGPSDEFRVDLTEDADDANDEGDNDGLQYGLTITSVTNVADDDGNAIDLDASDDVVINAEG